LPGAGFGMFTDSFEDSDAERPTSVSLPLPSSW
jgi:hypothetical protein